MKLLSYVFALLLLQGNRGTCLPQQNTRDSSDTHDSLSAYSSISVMSPIGGVRIYVDTFFIGLAPQESIQVSSGFHIMRFIHPDNRNWFLHAIVETVQLKPHEHIVFNVRFPRLCRISTNPFNADVAIGDSVYGTTPFMIPVFGESISLFISKDGFRSITTDLPGNRQQYRIDLERPVIPDMSNESLYLSPVTSKGYTSVYLSAGATILAGAAAAYCKIKADNYYSDYQRTGDAVALDRVRSFDTASGVSLVVAEMSFFLLSYLLFSQ